MTISPPRIRSFVRPLAATLMLLAIEAGAPAPALPRTAVLVPFAAPGDTLPSTADSLPPPASVAVGDTLLADAAAFVIDGALLFTAPLRFDGRDWLFAAAAVGGVASMTMLDEPIRTGITGNNTAGSDEGVFKAGNVYGTYWPAAAIAGSAYLGGLAFDLPEVRRAGRHVAQSVL